MRAYHFTSNKLRDGRPVPAIGERLVHDGPVELCASGLHASIDPFDALRHAPGAMLHLVELGGTVIQGDDKLAASERAILATIDATELLRAFARWCALQVIDRWDAPAVVHQYLETGDESLREKAHKAEAAGAAGAAAAAAAWAAEAEAEAEAAARAAAAAEAAWAAAAGAARNKQRAEFNRLVTEAFGDALQQP